MAAVKDRVAQAHHHSTPVTFTHASVQRVSDAFCKRSDKKIAQEFGIDRPEDERVSLMSRVGRVGIIKGIENKDWLRAVELFHRRQVEAFDRQLFLPFQRMMDHEHVEQKNGQREEVCLRIRRCLSTDNLWSHKTRRTVNAAFSLSVNRHIIIITDEHFTRFGVEESISE